jgi:hypothetical protein
MAEAMKPEWSGPTLMLFLREVNGVPCLFDDQGRMIVVFALDVSAPADSPVTARVTLPLARPDK